MSIRMTAEEKGLFIENVVINMFVASGRKVFHNGAERTNTEFYNHFNERKKKGDKVSYDPRLRQLLSKPDLIVQCVDGSYDFAEVKFRSVHHLPEEVAGESLIYYINMKKYFKTCREFWKPEIILVTSQPLETGIFTVLSDPYLEEKDKKTQMYFKAIGEVEKWGINPEIIKSYEEIVMNTLTT